jgi:hypothetical protein
MTVNEMLRTHPQASTDADALARCVDECFACAATCTSCADACLGEPVVQELVGCIRRNLDCADVCYATGSVLVRQTAFEAQLARTVLETCAQACRLCAEECERHASHHEHCRVCAEACRRCEQACEDLLSSMA